MECKNFEALHNGTKVMKLNNCKNLLLYASLGMYALLMIAGYYFFKDDWTAIQTIAVFLTGIVIIWYTWETKILREIAVAQLELQLRPYIVLSVNSLKFELSNLGTGVALNVKVRQIEKDDGRYKVKIVFAAPVTYIKPAQDIEIVGEVLINGERVSKHTAAFIDPNYATTESEIEIKYTNTEGKI